MVFCELYYDGHVIKCKNCNRILRPRRTLDIESMKSAAICSAFPQVYQQEEPRHGVGDEMYRILRDAGATCCVICGEWIAKMNEWGPDGCEARKAEIADRLKRAAGELRIAKTIETGVRLLFSRKMNILCPFKSLIEAAISKSREEKENGPCGKDSCPTGAT